jgi:hypothetical protein
VKNALSAARARNSRRHTSRADTVDESRKAGFLQRKLPIVAPLVLVIL